MPSTAVFVGLLVVLFIGLSLLLPAGYGLPSPVWALFALLLVGPALFVGWLLYRQRVSRGDIPRIGEGGPDPDPEDPGRRSPRRHARAMRSRARTAGR